MNEEKPQGYTPLDANPVAPTREVPAKGEPTINERDGIRKDLSEFEIVTADIQRKNLAATRVIAWVTALYMAFAALQWWTMRSQLREMRASGEDTAKIAQSIKDNADTAKAAMRISHRPWVLVKGVDFIGGGANGPIAISITLVNSGATPAVNVVASISVIGCLSTADLTNTVTVGGTETFGVSKLPDAVMKLGPAAFDAELRRKLGKTTDQDNTVDQNHRAMSSPDLATRIEGVGPVIVAGDTGVIVIDYRTAIRELGEPGCFQSIHGVLNYQDVFGDEHATIIEYNALSENPRILTPTNLHNIAN